MRIRCSFHVIKSERATPFPFTGLLLELGVNGMVGSLPKKLLFQKDIISLKHHDILMKQALALESNLPNINPGFHLLLALGLTGKLVNSYEI